MPKTLYVSKYKNSGVDITYTKSSRKLSIGGWHDGTVGIESKEISLKEFMNELGITLNDVKKELE
jgi:hypothetical protein